MCPLTRCDCNETDSVKKKYNFLVFAMMTRDGCAEYFSCDNILVHVLTQINLQHFLPHYPIRKEALYPSANPKFRHKQRR